jgi:DNA (cytosine-5)-methyltransferase 3A
MTRTTIGGLLLNKSLKVLSLFDGISCGRVALERAGYAVSIYEAFEIDKYARAITRYRYPDTIHHGDVMDADFSKFAKHDLVIGGSPCTFWSIAKTGREVDKNGIGWELFMRFVEAVRIIKPRFFLYENVASMPSNIKAYISEEFSCEPVLINSALLSAQQRKRLYWTNIQGVTQPEDKGILLKDILESGVSYINKSHCMTATYSGAE